jgi:hypothetical protein
MLQQVDDCRCDWKQPQQQPADDNSINCTQDEFDLMKQWAKKLRFWYIGIASFLVVTALLSFVSLTVITSGFLAFYVLIFSCLICCYEIGLKVMTLPEATLYYNNELK